MAAENAHNMTDAARLRDAAMILSDFLATTALRDEAFASSAREPYQWERQAFDWLAEQKRRDPDTPLNAWTAVRLREMQGSHRNGSRAPEGE